MIRYHSLSICFFVTQIVMAQTEYPDTIRQLNEVIIQAYQYNRTIEKVPASIGVLGITELQRFNESTLVPSINTIPGVRIEERSPGSYRLSIRGSTLRSPFGVRNVKVYWNNIPLTDAGGNTYLNQLDPAMLGSSEIIKGPGSSLYGAGTGGVVLLTSKVPEDGHHLVGVLQTGSFGGELMQLAYKEAKEKSSHQIQVMHQQSDGYRNQTRMSRDVVNSEFRFEVDDDQVLETFIFYSDLFYETPGGLTASEFNVNPKQARPATATTPGAEAQHASVHLQSFYMGVAHEYFISADLHNRTSVYGNLVKFENPSIRNFEHRNEQNFGARSVTSFTHRMGEVNFSMLGGGEFQWGFSPIKTYQNLQGKEGNLQLDDEVKIMQYSILGQGEMTWKKVSVTAGLSYNAQQLNFHRLSDVNTQAQHLKYNPVLMPRIAVLVNAMDNVSFFSSVSKGFSPPTLAEINASNGIFNKELKAETGINYEVGFRAKLFSETLRTEVTAYSFNLDETIVIRRDASGAEFFANAGETNQRGIEFSMRYSPVLKREGFLKKTTFWTSYAYNHYRFGEYIKGKDNFTGKQLTGTPATVLSFGFDVALRAGIYLRTTILYTGKLPLNDANTAFADSYYLPGIRVGYLRKKFEVYVGGDNLLDETYSLGNDLNAFGGRYFNTAPARNFYGGIKINLSF